MHKNATKCNETPSKWCKNKHGASKIMDTLETYHLGAGAARPESHQTGQNQGWHFIWWPGSHPESQKAHVDWMLSVSIAVRAEHNAWCLFPI
jgi:hypothetical protein